MAYGFGLITGAALTITLPYIVMKIKEMECSKDQENHESSEASKVKDEIVQEFSKLSDDVNENVSQFMTKMENKISKKKKKKDK